MALVHNASDLEVLSSYTGISSLQRLSIYADDVTLFVKPSWQDLSAVREMLDVFGEASGLKVNYRKSLAILIRGDQEDRDRVAGLLQCGLAEFPCKYLGLRLAIRSLTRAEWMPMLDLVRKVIPAWQRGLIQRPSRLVLVQSVIVARPVHHLMITDAPV